MLTIMSVDGSIDIAVVSSERVIVTWKDGIGMNCPVELIEHALDLYYQGISVLSDRETLLKDLKERNSKPK